LRITTFMARKRTTVHETEGVPETDRLEGFPHPRETTDFVGNTEVLDFVSRAICSGRPPQAWLIAGPPGLGKATLAYRITRYLLVYGATDAGPQDLSVPERDPQARLVSGRSILKPAG
jgi:DNA polymerase-3 subunit delta'